MGRKGVEAFIVPGLPESSLAADSSSFLYVIEEPLSQESWVACLASSIWLWGPCAWPE